VTRAEIIACQDNARKQSPNSSDEALWEIALQLADLNHNLQNLRKEIARI
jgi:hypothetical protein